MSLYGRSFQLEGIAHSGSALGAGPDILIRAQRMTFDHTCSLGEALSVSEVAILANTVRITRYEVCPGHLERS